LAALTGGDGKAVHEVISSAARLDLVPGADGPFRAMRARTGPAGAGIVRLRDERQRVHLGGGHRANLMVVTIGR
jgi:hypothetical protein